MSGCFREALIAHGSSAVESHTLRGTGVLFSMAGLRALGSGRRAWLRDKPGANTALFSTRNLRSFGYLDVADSGWRRP